jgi:hypothetical protein
MTGIFPGPKVKKLKSFFAASIFAAGTYQLSQGKSGSLREKSFSR